MDIPKWIIYCHTHKVSQRRYIGLTKMTMMRRWKGHVNNARRSNTGFNHFMNAIRKYGSNAFEHLEFSVKYSTLEEANKAEEFAIEFFCTRNPDFGFNLAKGGGSQPHPLKKNPWNRPEYRAKNLQRFVDAGHTLSSFAKMKESHNTSEYKQKASLISKEIMARSEVLAKIITKTKGIKRTKEQCVAISLNRKGKKLSLETRAKISAANKGRILSSETRAKYSHIIRNRVHTKGRICRPETRAKISLSNKITRAKFKFILMIIEY
jgi:GIY-YIG catalytic domain/NUMOD3 motif